MVGLGTLVARSLPDIRRYIRISDYGDVALEYLGNSKTGAPGWIAKHQWTDVLLYGHQVAL